MACGTRRLYCVELAALVNDLSARNRCFLVGFNYGWTVNSTPTLPGFCRWIQPIGHLLPVVHPAISYLAPRLRTKMDITNCLANFCADISQINSVLTDFLFSSSGIFRSNFVVHSGIYKLSAYVVYHFMTRQWQFFIFFLNFIKEQYISLLLWSSFIPSFLGLNHSFW